MDFDASIPIYLQIVEQIREKVVSGKWAAGERVAPVRDLAAQFSVNPNTMQRAMAELEREGLLRSERTAGRFVTEDTALVAQCRAALVNTLTARFAADMTRLGIPQEEILAAVRQSFCIINGKEDEHESR